MQENSILKLLEEKELEDDLVEELDWIEAINLISAEWLNKRFCPSKEDKVSIS